MYFSKEMGKHVEKHKTLLNFITLVEQDIDANSFVAADFGLGTLEELFKLNPCPEENRVVLLPLYYKLILQIDKYSDSKMTTREVHSDHMKWVRDIRSKYRDLITKICPQKGEQ